MATKRILVAVDGSPAASSAILVALDLAIGQRAELTFVHFSGASRDLYDAAAPEAPLQEAIREGDAILREAAEAAEARGLEAEVKALEAHGTSDIASAICGIAEGIGAAMIIVGTRGRSAAAGAMLGSVTHTLLEVATLPVVAVHAVNESAMPAR